MFSKQPKIFKLISANDALAIRKSLQRKPTQLEALNKYGQTPLIYAAYSNSPVALSALLEFDLNLNAQSAQGNTALHLAAANGYSQIITTLLEVGARTDIINNNGKTAEDLAKSGVKSLFKADNDTLNIAAPLPAGFQKQSDYIASITAHTQTPALSITSIYNFQAKTVSYLSAEKGAAPNVQPLTKAASPSELQDAAQFFTNEGGDVCGFKLRTII